VGLKDVFQKAAKTGFNVFNDFVEQVPYKKAHDDGFGNVSNTIQTIQFIRTDFETAVRAMGWRDSSQYMAEGILTSDVTGFVLAPECEHPLEEGAEITLSGKKYTLKKRGLDAAGALYTVFLRRG
jgi:hypothetical protein